ncbi:MAG: 23S rRNA (guanosine(2251)-2'-O)-methyltransferase RlmB [Ilumatobacter sp.]|uniref:23S rRNA (guanosine(2251)-2'-O)-methyltransferase RlmB n=1 Tax=Ilumatobacter sp. TaxID=1967498 RepID=UPI00391A0066
MSKPTGRGKGGGSRGSNPGSGRPGAGRPGAGRPGGGRPGAGRGGSGRPGAARTGSSPNAPGAAKPGGKVGGPKSLGGRQVEGRQPTRELLMGERRKVHEIWISAELEGDPGVEDIVMIANARRVPVAYVAKAKVEREARTDAPQGVVAFAADIPEADLGQLMRIGRDGASPFLVAVDGVTDPGNLGAIIRSCDGAGVSGVLLPRHRAVHVTPTVAKASAGAVEHMPIALVPGLPATLKQLKDHGIWIVGLDDAADQDLFELVDLAKEPICLVLGAEGAGLSRLVRERCDLIVSIPMLGGVSSLNVSAAAALSAYQITRVRRAGS